MKNIIKKAWFWIALAVIVFGGAGIYAAIVGSRPTVQTSFARRSEIVVFVDERGKTRVPLTFDITMPFAGRIEDVELDVGDRVTKGQLVVQLSPTDLANEVAEAQAAVERLEASIVENDDTRLEQNILAQMLKFVESFGFTVNAAEERANASQLRMNYAETRYGRLQRLMERNATSEDNLDRAKLQFDEAQKTFTQDNFVLSAIRAINSATGLIPRMVEIYIEDKSLSHAVLEKQLQEAKVRLERALLRKGRGSIVSPIDGTVLTRDLHAEQFLAAGTKLMTVGALTELEVEADLLSQEVVDVAIDAKCEIYGPATGREVGEGVRGRVSRVHPAGFSKLSSLGVEQQRVRIIVTLEDEARALLLQEGVGADFRVRVRVFTDQKADALVVPRTSLFRGPRGGWQLFAVKRGIVRLTNVEVGLMNDELAEIEEGIGEGEEVVLAPESHLDDGTRVRSLREPGTNSSSGS